MRHRRPTSALLPVLLAFGLLLAPPASGAVERLPAPALESPAAGVAVEALPAFTWKPVKGAAQYEFQLAADAGFAAIPGGRGVGKGQYRTRNTAATVDAGLPDGSYFWRVRAITKDDVAGRWTAGRPIEKRWSTAPVLTGPDGLAVPWPASPLVLRWNPVAHATDYLVTVAGDPAMANVVLGTATRPVRTSGTALAVPGTLPSGRWYWTVQPVDAQGHKGTRSRVASFEWAWPTQTQTQTLDLDPEPRVFVPHLSWAPIPGAVRYEVEINAAQDFPAGSKWCCDDPPTTTGLSLVPREHLANNRYFWRVRGLDAEGNAGRWNEGAPFEKTFDDVDPTVPGLRLVDGAGQTVGGTVPETDAPLLDWDVVPGAAGYTVTIARWTAEDGCDFNGGGVYERKLVQTTAYTPLATGGKRVVSGSEPTPATYATLPPGAWCARLVAYTTNDSANAPVTSRSTTLGSAERPGFVKTDEVPPAAAPGAPARPRMAASDYGLPAQGSTTDTTPYFTWKRQPGADGYYFVLGRDKDLTKVVDVAFLEEPGYAPRDRRGLLPLTDETTDLFWAVIPTYDGKRVFSEALDNSVRSFQKSSVAPEPLMPVGGAVLDRQPEFRWTRADGARVYRLQVARDPSFADPLEDLETTATAYTSARTYPADTELLWRVRAELDEDGRGLRWSRPERFQRVLRAPVPAAGNPLAGEQLPVLQWTPMEGAEGYDLHVDQADGSSKDFPMSSTAFTPVQFYGMGIWRWRVRARYPASTGQTSASAWSAPMDFTRTIQPPTGARGTYAGGRLLFTWNPNSAAKRFRVEISATDGFERIADAATVDGTSWAPALSTAALRSGGRFFWRVQTVDDGGNRGAPARGTLAIGRTLQVAATSAPRRGTRGTLALRVTDAGGKAVKGVRLTVSGKGIRKALRRTTDARGQARLRFTPPRTGPIVVVARRTGFQTGRATVKVLARPKRR